MDPSQSKHPPSTNNAFTLQSLESTTPHHIAQHNQLLQHQSCSEKSIEFSVRRIMMTIKTKKGRKNETKNLSKIVKDHTYRFLRAQVATKVLNQSQKEIVEMFRSQTGSLASILRLFENEKISTLCRQFYQSSELIRQILQSQKLAISRKIEVLKYLNEISTCTRHKTPQWKSKNKWRN